MQCHLRAIVFVTLTATFESGCHKNQGAVPVPPAPSPTTTAPETTTPAATPSTATAPATTPPATTEEKPARRQPARTPTTTSPNATPNQPPHLGTILTPEQQRQYNIDIDRSLGRAQATLRSIGNRQLTAEQHDRVAQVENFIQQAQTMRKTNLAGAKSMAERADVLARDLAASLR